MSRLKEIAVEKGICLIILSQVLENCNLLEQCEISNNTLFKSGTRAITDNSDIIRLLYRPVYYDYYRYDLLDLSEMIFLKGGNSNIRKIRMIFKSDYAKFINRNTI